MVQQTQPPWAQNTDRLQANTLPASKTQPRTPFMWVLANAYTLLFTALQLAGHIDWPLWLILLPVLICFGLILLVGIPKSVSAARRGR